ncbi:MAG: hypothetical protein MHMPM18_004614, partial [Marteilia pararefringens]
MIKKCIQRGFTEKCVGEQLEDREDARKKQKEEKKKEREMILHHEQKYEKEKRDEELKTRELVRNKCEEYTKFVENKYSEKRYSDSKKQTDGRQAIIEDSFIDKFTDCEGEISKTRNNMRLVMEYNKNLATDLKKYEDKRNNEPCGNSGSFSDVEGKKREIIGKRIAERETESLKVGDNLQILRNETNKRFEILQSENRKDSITSKILERSDEGRKCPRNDQKFECVPRKTPTIEFPVERKENKEQIGDFNNSVLGKLIDESKKKKIALSNVNQAPIENKGESEKLKLQAALISDYSNQ